MEAYIQEHGFNDFFDPVNLKTTIQFVADLDKKVSMSLSKTAELVCFVQNVPNSLTKAVFLLGAYLVLKHEHTATRVEACFKKIPGILVQERKTKDQNTQEPDLRLSLVDCWRALEKGQRKGWIRRPSALTPYLWGKIDIEAYGHYDDPLHADLNEIVPGEILSFRGPRDLGGPSFRDNMRDGRFRSRDFSPEYFADILKDLGVSAVVRVNSPHYDRQVFVERGFEHVDLDFGGGPTPPSHAANQFLKLVEQAGGVVAVHGSESLGRAGTLIALHLMRSHGFGALEAVAWLRIMRPGSVLAEQLRYLVGIEESLRAVAASVGAFRPSRAQDPADLGAEGVGGLRPMAEAIKWQSTRRLLSGLQKHFSLSSRGFAAELSLSTSSAGPAGTAKLSRASSSAVPARTAPHRISRTSTSAGPDRTAGPC